MVGGVLLGIAVAEILSALIGRDTVALGLIVLTTMLLAVLLGAGFVGEGMMFVNQAAASRLLVTVPGHGDRRRAGSRRAGRWCGGVGCRSDSLPADPLPRLRDAERAVLRSLSSALEQVGALVRSGEQPGSDWTLATGYEIHEQLARLADARITAKANVRIAPRRWHLHRAIDAEDQRIAQLDLLANSMLSLVRAVTGAIDDGESRQQR